MDPGIRPTTEAKRTPPSSGSESACDPTMLPRPVKVNVNAFADIMTKSSPTERLFVRGEDP